MNPQYLRYILYNAVLCLSGRRGQIRFFEDMRRRQHDSFEKTRAEHSARLGRMLCFSFMHVPYYRKIFQDCGLNSECILEDPEGALYALPLLDKRVLRESLDDLVSDDLHNRKWHYNASGGSTGEPVRFVQDSAYHHAGMAGKYLFDEWTGYRLGGTRVVLWGSERDLLVGRETWRSRIGNRIRNEYRLNTFRMGDADMYDFVEIINQVRPVQILAYAESVYELARFIERNNLSVHAPNAVMTSAGTLYPHMRRVVEKVFRTQVFNRYGSREVGNVACECECHKGLHVNPYTHHLEIIREDGTLCNPGELGEVVVTLMVNEAMPLLRYRIGDMAAWSEEICDCGRHWPLLREVSGRVADNFINKQGELVHGEYFTHLLYFKMWCKRFQFVQEACDRVRLLVVPALEKNKVKQIIEQERLVLEKDVRQAMGSECELSIEMVDDIPSSASGKYRYTVSKVWGG